MWKEAVLSCPLNFCMLKMEPCFWRWHKLKSSHYTLFLKCNDVLHIWHAGSFGTSMWWLFRLFHVPSCPDSTSLGNSLKHPVIYLFGWVNGSSDVAPKNEWSWNVEVSGARLERPIGWDACDIIFCFPTAEVMCRCWEHWCMTWPGAVLCVCVFSHINYRLGLRDYHLAYDLWTGVTCFKMSSQFSHFINTKTQNTPAHCSFLRVEVVFENKVGLPPSGTSDKSELFYCYVWQILI